MNIGLYFGSFNPIHIGHLIIASHVLAYTDMQKIWFIVSPQNPLKPAAGLLNEHHRLHLVQLAIEQEPGFKASSVEFKLPRPSYTIDTLTHLQDAYPTHQFSVILGSDSLQNFSKWKNYQQILDKFSLIVYERPGFPPSQQIKGRIQYLKAPMLDISSTEIRQRLKNRKSVRFLLPDAVMEHILANGYYR